METRVTIQLTDTRAYVAHYELRQRRWQRVTLREHEVHARYLPQEEADLVELAQQLASWLLGEYPRGMVCRLVIPASWCLIHHVELPSNHWNEQAAEFAFEQYVPVELETLTCASRRIDRGQALVVGVCTESLRTFLGVLEGSLIAVDVLTVDAALLEKSRPISMNGEPFGVLVIDDSRVTVAVVDGRTGAVRDVRTVGLPPGGAREILTRHLTTAASLVADSCRRWRVLPLSGTADAHEATRVLQSMGAEVEVVAHTEVVGHFLDAATAFENPLDLRRHSLAYPGRCRTLHRRLVCCANAACVLLATWVLRQRVENVAYADTITELRSLQGQIYQRAFPGEQVPPGSALRLRSECTKLEGLTQRAGADVTELRPSGLQAFELLHEVTSRIPGRLKLHVNEVLLDDQGITLAGQTTTHGAAGELVQELNRVSGLAADPPRTKLRKDQTVDFRLRAKRIGDAKRP